MVVGMIRLVRMIILYAIVHVLVARRMFMVIVGRMLVVVMRMFSFVGVIVISALIDIAVFLLSSMEIRIIRDGRRRLPAAIQLCGSLAAQVLQFLLLLVLHISAEA